MNRDTSSSSANAPQASSYDELFMQHRLIFADSLKDLKNIRKQLYSAAEYFETSYDRDDQKQLVVETLKDYVTNALISTVDHLGSVANKVNTFLDEKVDNVSETQLRISSMDQRLRACQEYIDRSGVLQQSLVIETPKYHKRYIIPVGSTVNTTGKTKSIYNAPGSCLEDDLHQSTQATVVKPQSSLLRKGLSTPPSVESLTSPATFLFSSNKGLDEQRVSPLRFPLKRPGSVTNRSVSPSISKTRQQYASGPQRSTSLCIRPERQRTIKEIEQYSKRSKSLLKTLLRYTSPRRVRN